MPKIRLFKLIDPIITGNLLYLLLVLAQSMLLRGFLSRETVGYAAFCLLHVLLFYQVFVLGGYYAGQTAIPRRMREERKSDTYRIILYLRRFLWGAGLILSLLLYAFHGRLSLLYHGSRQEGILYRLLALCLFLFAIGGGLVAYYAAVGIRRTLVVHIGILLTGTAVLVPLLGRILYRYGEKVGALLQKKEAADIYAAGGVLWGIAVTACIADLYLLVYFFLVRRSVREHLLEGTATVVEERGSRSEILRHMLIALLPAMTLFLLPGLLPIVDYLFCGISREERFSAVLTSGLYGVVYACVAFFVFLLVISMSGLLHTILRENRKTSAGVMEGRLRILFRLSTYYAVPFAFFVFASAAAFTLQEEVLSAMLHISCMNILFAGELILFAIILLRNDQALLVLATECIAFGLQLVLLLLLSRGSMHGARALAICVTLFYLFWCVALCLAARRTLGCLFKEAYRFGLELLCGAIAAIPIFFLSGALYRGLGVVATILLTGIVYLGFYLVLTIFLGAADLGNLHRVPFGRWIPRLANILFPMPYEDEE